MKKEYKILIPPKIQKVYSKASRFKALRGGRGSGKTKSVAKIAATFGALTPMTWFRKKNLRILCAREFMNSLKESSLSELKAVIQEDELISQAYDVGTNYIRGINGTEFIFVGLSRNVDSVKSIGNIDICWIEEAENVSEESWRKLIPTIRNESSEIWLNWNPEDEDSATNQRFIKNTPGDCRMEVVNYYDNPWFPDVLEKERLEDFEKRPDLYHHVWEGQYKTISDAQIFAGKYKIEDFSEPIDANGSFMGYGPYYGTDFGFSQDPTAFIRCYIWQDCLYISHESGGVQVGNRDLISSIYSRIPGYDKFTIYGDSARPETIHYLSDSDQNGEKSLNVVKCEKWPGSVEDGIDHIKGSYKKVIIHPRCKETIKEFKYYSYKVDKRSEKPLPVILDDHNHYIDALRYALGPVIRAGKESGTFELI